MAMYVACVGTCKTDMTQKNWFEAVKTPCSFCANCNDNVTPNSCNQMT